jgi:hypothetical protein
MNELPDQAASARIRAATLAAIAHDLRGAPARMLQYLELIAPSQVPAHLHETLSACARGQLQLVDDLLQFSRQELSAPQALPAPAWLHGLMQQVAYEAGTGAGGLAVRWDCAGQLPAVVDLDGALLAQLLGRLLAHAGAARQEGARQCELSVALAMPALAPEPGRALLLRFSAGLVGDPGAASLVPLALAHPLQEDARSGRSAALNLAVAQQLAQALGSCLQVDPGGRSARLYLDLAAMAGSEAEAALPMPVPEAPADLGHSWSVLLMGEPGLAGELLADSLENGGFAVHHALAPDAALDLLARLEAGPEGPGRVLVIADDAFASGPLARDAWDLLQAIAQRYPARTPPVLLHAARAVHRPPGLAPGLEFAAILYRPLSQALLFDVLRRLMAPPPAPG